MNGRKFTPYLFILILSSCSPVEKAINYKEISNTHKLIAVLPAKVNIEIKNSKDAEKIKEQEIIEAIRFQKSLVAYIRDHAQKGDFFVDIQPENETNAILLENGITSLKNRSYQDLAKMLKVDAVISSRVSLANPMSNSEAVLTALVTGGQAHSKISSVDLSITDAVLGKTFWNYSWQTGGTFSSSTSLTNSMMRSAAYRFPYKKGDKMSK